MPAPTKPTANNRAMAPVLADESGSPSPSVDVILKSCWGDTKAGDAGAGAGSGAGAGAGPGSGPGCGRGPGSGPGGIGSRFPIFVYIHMYVYLT